MMQMRALLTLITGFCLAGPPAFAAEVAVGSQAGALSAAIQDAEPGDILRLGNAEYSGPIIIEKPLTIVGQEGSRITGPKSGTVITVKASDVVIKGTTISGSGLKLDKLNAGIAIEEGTERVQVIANRLIGNLIGVDVQGGHDAVVRNNFIVGRDDLHRSERGPGIYVWNAPGLLVEENDISKGRDGIFVTTSHHAIYRNNYMHDLRFAFHSMYANDIQVSGNHSSQNDMGFAFMYSRVVDAQNNLSVGDKTHGIFMNYVTGAKIAHNEVRDGGEKCIFAYNVNKARLEANRFEGCDIGIHYTGGSQDVAITGNAFIANRTQVKYVSTRWLEWSEEGRGNYWSDQPSFDVNGDGIADSAYRPNDLIDRVTWSQPMAKLLMGSPAVQLIRWSQSRFPGLLPGGVIDSNPLVSAEAAGLKKAELARRGQ
jgi:nitrous oxidase accessory protein